jgi:hypothetical protein
MSHRARTHCVESLSAHFSIWNSKVVVIMVPFFQ